MLPLLTQITTRAVNMEAVSAYSFSNSSLELLMAFCKGTGVLKHNTVSLFHLIINKILRARNLGFKMSYLDRDRANESDINREKQP